MYIYTTYHKRAVEETKKGVFARSNHYLIDKIDIDIYIEKERERGEEMV